MSDPSAAGRAVVSSVPDPLVLPIYRGLLVTPKLFGLFPSTAAAVTVLAAGSAALSLLLGTPPMLVALVSVVGLVALSAVLRGLEAGRSVPWLESLPARFQPKRWVPHRELRR